ncbi:MAG: Flp family type IVb pilin, partial [Albidovulum sp.]
REASKVLRLAWSKTVRSYTMTLFKNFAKDESGATAIEYALIAALLSVAVIAALQTLGGKLSGTYNKIGTYLPAA